MSVCVNSENVIESKHTSDPIKVIVNMRNLCRQCNEFYGSIKSHELETWKCRRYFCANWLRQQLCWEKLEREVKSVFKMMQNLFENEMLWEQCKCCRLGSLLNAWICILKRYNINFSNLKKKQKEIEQIKIVWNITTAISVLSNIFV